MIPKEETFKGKKIHPQGLRKSLLQKQEKIKKCEKS